MWWRTKLADENSIPQQIQHIESELYEIKEELYLIRANLDLQNELAAERAVHRMKQEALDLIQSTYTLLHILGMTEREHEKMKCEMEVKNHERGYYRNERD